MPDIGDFIRRSQRSAKIAIAAPGTPGDFRRSGRSAYKIARCVAGFRQFRFQLETQCVVRHFLDELVRVITYWRACLSVLLASCTIGRIQAQEKKNNKERKVGNGKKNGTGEKVEGWTPRFSLFHSSSLSPLERGRRLSGGERCRPKRIRSAILSELTRVNFGHDGSFRGKSDSRWMHFTHYWCISQGCENVEDESNKTILESRNTIARCDASCNRGAARSFILFRVCLVPIMRVALQVASCTRSNSSSIRGQVSISGWLGIKPSVPQRSPAW